MYGSSSYTLYRYVKDKRAGNIMEFQMPNSVRSINRCLQTKPQFKLFLDELRLRGGDEEEIFTAKEEFVNKTYSERWKLSNSSTRGKSTSLVRLYELGLSYGDTCLLLDVFKYWARTTSPGTTDSRIGVVCNIIKIHGFLVISDATYLKSIYGSFTTSFKKNINYLFLVLHDRFLKFEFKEQRAWAKDNLPSESVNPHDPVNGAYSDNEFNNYIDSAMVGISTDRNAWLERGSQTSFRIYSNALCHLFSLISSRRPAQLGQCKICDLSVYSDRKDDVHVDGQVIEIIFHKSKINNSGFRAKPEGSYFPFSEFFSNIISIYLIDYKTMLEGFCKSFDCKFKELPWASYPLFPDILSIKSKDDLKSPSMHSDLLHRTLSIVTSHADYSIARVRHTAITRGMELGLNTPQLARLTGVTTSAIKNYKDLTPQSRQMINERFSKNAFLGNSFSWTLQDYNENFGVVHTDEFGCNLGGIQKEVGCSSCSKKLGAPLGCYACGADLFVPFLEGDHKSQLIKAQAKKEFLEKNGANHHQTFEIDIIIRRIKQVIAVQNNIIKRL